MSARIRSVDTLVIGGGAMGSATAWQLARRGRDVELVERFEPGHTNGASHGASRNFNVSYSEKAYVDLLVEALPLWRELEAEAGADVLTQVGIVNHGREPRYDAVHEALTAAGIPSAFVPLAEAAERWPGIRPDSRVLFTPTAGRIHAGGAVAALNRATVAAGGAVRHGVRALGLDVVDDDRVEIELETTATGERERVSARTVVVAVGAWTSGLLGGAAGSRLASALPGLALPPLVVTQEQPAHFGVRAGIDDATLAAWPGFNHRPAEGDDAYGYWYSPVYGMHTPGEGIKAGWHGTGPVTDPDARTFRAEQRQLDALRRYVSEWLPGADPDAVTEISCTYTTTPDSAFVLDRVGPVVVGAGFSGQGFKFTPVVGRILADLASGADAAAGRAEARVARAFRLR